MTSYSFTTTPYPALTVAYPFTETFTEYEMKLLRELFAYGTPMRLNLRFRPQ